MGSKKWTSSLGAVGFLLGGHYGAAIGTGGGLAIDKKHNKKNGSGGGAVADVETEEEKNAREMAAGEGGESPFGSGALGVTTKKKKLNTLVGGYSSGALSGAGIGGASTTLG